MIRVARGFLLLTAGCASAPTDHVGPILDLAVVDDRVFACSQAGVEGPEGWVRPAFRPTSIAVSGDAILVGGGTPAVSGEVALFRGGRRLAHRRLAKDQVYAVALHPDGRRAAAGAADGSVFLLSLPDLQTLRQLDRHTAPCRAVCFSAEGTVLATAGRDGLVRIHDLVRGESLTLKDHTAGVDALLFRGTQLYSGATDGKIRVHTGSRLTRTYQGNHAPVLGLVRDGETVFAGLGDGRVCELHDDATFRVVADIPALFCLACGQNGFVFGTLTGLRTQSFVRSTGQASAPQPSTFLPSATRR